MSESRVKPLLSSLEEILQWLRGYRRKVVSALLPGLSELEIRTRASALRLALPQEVVDFFAWRNGTLVHPGEILDDVHLFPGFYFLSLDDSILTYRALVSDDRWRASWLPLFANGGGDFYAVDCAKGDGEHAPIVGFIVGEANQPVEYESLSRMVATLAECYRKNVFFLRSDGVLEADDRAHARLARVLNPSLEIWRETD